MCPAVSLCLGGSTVSLSIKKNNTFNSKKLNNPKQILKRFVIASTLIGALSMTSVIAYAKDNISTVYHVYLNDERIGIVDNKELIEKAIDEKIKEAKEEYKNFQLSADGLTYIAEKTFRPNATNRETVETFLSKVEVVTEATALQVNGKTVAYLKTKEEAESVIRQLKLQYISEEALQEVESRKLANAKAPEATEDLAIIIDVTLSAEVTLNEDEASPSQILTVQDAVKLLQKGTLEEKKYHVQEGDVLGSIAIAHNLSTAELLSLNPGLEEDTLLQINQEINVTALKAFVDVIIHEAIVKREEIPYQNETKEDSSMFKGDKKVKQEGQKGEKIVDYLVEKKNGQVVKKTPTEEKVIKEPVNHIVIKGTKVVPSRGTGQLAWPAVGGYISSKMGYRWGQMHKGIDIARPSSRTIKAADNGTIVYAGWDGGYGNKVIINHNNGLRTVYAHLSSITVRVGQTVSKGQQLGNMGSTGNSTGVHLHFEVYKNGKLVDPLNYVNRR
ncbi:M23 family metallopeptidase [Cytobacillus suaedae]|nr:M23 family metallopeptidase [Cytobacillus suaedae]